MLIESLGNRISNLRPVIQSSGLSSDTLIVNFTLVVVKPTIKMGQPYRIGYPQQPRALVSGTGRFRVVQRGLRVQSENTEERATH